MRHAHGGKPPETHLPPPGRLPHSETSRVPGFALGLIVGAALLVVVVLLSGRMASVVVGGAEDFDQRTMRRSVYLVRLCSDVAPADAQELCACVRSSEDPGRACTASYHAWAVARQAERCADAGLREQAEAYCDCVDEAAQAMDEAIDATGRRRAAQRHEICEDARGTLPLPELPNEMHTNAGGR
jgi:hypothetical protein